MRRLLHVPVLHDLADLGSAGEGLARASSTLWGEGRWRLHQATVDRYWESIRAYLLSLDAPRLRVYQDGLAAEGEMGRRVVEEAARRGSRNYALVLSLLERGAQLQKTEDPALLLQERALLLTLLEAAGPPPGHLQTPAVQEAMTRLLEARDRFIASTINATLQEGVLGLLFIGAQHQVDAHLAKDIRVQAVKSPQRVREYFQALAQELADARVTALAEDLAAPVEVQEGW